MPKVVVGIDAFASPDPYALTVVLRQFYLRHEVLIQPIVCGEMIITDDLALLECRAVEVTKKTHEKHRRMHVLAGLATGQLRVGGTPYRVDYLVMCNSHQRDFSGIANDAHIVRQREARSYDEACAQDTVWNIAKRIRDFYPRSRAALT